MQKVKGHNKRKKALENYESCQCAYWSTKSVDAVQGVPQKVQQALEREGPHSDSLRLAPLRVRPVLPDIQLTRQSGQTPEKACLPAVGQY